MRSTSQFIIQIDYLMLLGSPLQTTNMKVEIYEEMEMFSNTILLCGPKFLQRDGLWDPLQVISLF